MLAVTRTADNWNFEMTRPTRSNRRKCLVLPNSIFYLILLKLDLIMYISTHIRRMIVQEWTLDIPSAIE
jgi:hypothetical protein